MITNDSELQITRKQLCRAESILDSTRRDFLPHNEVQYRLFAGTTIDLIQSIRGEIEDYLGIPAEADLTVSLEGEDVHLGQISVGLITRTIDTLCRGLQSVVGVLHVDIDPSMSSRRAGWIERLCDLSLAGMGTKSVRVFLDLPTSIEGFFPEDEWRFLKDAITVLFDGLEWAAQEDQAVPPSLERLSAISRQTVLGVVSRLLPPQSGPVERIAYRRRSDGPTRPPRQATLTRQSRQRVQGEMERLAADRKCTKVEAPSA